MPAFFSRKIALSRSTVDPGTVERESAILREKNAGKPDGVLAKIVESGLKSFYKDNTLLDQAFVYEPSKSVGQLLKELALEADIDPRNDASARLLERMAFQREGMMRERWIVNGEICDTAFYGLLKREWETRHIA